MNQKLWSGLIATLVTTALSTTSSTHAEQPQAVQSQLEANKLRAYTLATPTTNIDPVDVVKGGSSFELGNTTNSQMDEVTNRPSVIPTQPANAHHKDVVKVGEYQSQVGNNSDENSLAKIHSHELAGRQAATIYVRDIPVLTFLGSVPHSPTSSKIGASVDGKDTVESVEQVTRNDSKEPVGRASAIAAKLNQLARENIDANNITVIWNPENDSTPTTNLRQSATDSRRNQGTIQNQPESYIIQVNGEKLVLIDPNTRLPDSTNNLAEDALQVTNRLRRLIGNAPALRNIAGLPAPKRIQVALSIPRPVTARLTGLASWYGPGFHGNRSANGEIYNQNAFTAAHRSLPFGTQVRVTNLNNGLSVIVRINDRGPYSRGRIIDLSAAAARSLGMINTGVANVTLEILPKPETVAIDEN